MAAMGFHLREVLELVEGGRAGVDWEESPCLLCGGSNWAPFLESPDRARGGSGLWFMIVECRDCGLCFTNPRPSASSIGDFYADDYAPHQAAAKPGRGPRWWQRLPLVGRRPDLLRKILPLHGQGRLLDFGCGSGSFLLRMRRQGWKVTGVDASESVVDRLRADHGLHAFSGSLPHPALDEGSFDVITMWQALEHVHQPLEILQSARELLCPGGKIIVAVPNIDCLAFHLFGTAWNGLDLPRHLVHFNPVTLRLMLKRAGFRSGRVSMVRRSGWLRSSARLAKRQFVPNPRWCHWLEGKMMSHVASWFAYWTRQADCMLITATRDDRARDGPRGR
jgi:SAM-dependent methyltransferase